MSISEFDITKIVVEWVGGGGKSQFTLNGCFFTSLPQDIFKKYLIKHKDINVLEWNYI